ncbi:MAG: aminoacyl--tRNA ligase-related protein [Candidatus Dojkabacteria bacterium]
MNYVVISKQGKIYNANEYIQSLGFNNLCSSQNAYAQPGFIDFIRREAFEEVIVSPKDEKPEYLHYASKLGFNWEPNAGAGLVQYDYRAHLIMRLVQDYARQLMHKIGFPIYEMLGSNMFDESYPVVEAYANLYGDRLFKAGSGKNKHYIMGYDASYPQFNLAAGKKLSHKNLPFGHFSISDCYRYEQRGELMMLYRGRRFFMPDLHPYFKDVHEAFEWYSRIEEVLIEAAGEANREYHIVAEVASEQVWNQYQEEIKAIAVNGKRDILVGIHEDQKDRYWIINVDYKIMDKLGQSREIACIQIDVGNAARLGIEYMDKNGNKQNPAIIHSAVPGGFERYLYMILDNFKESMPLWLYPVQVRLIPVAGENNQYSASDQEQRALQFCQKIVEKYAYNIRIEIDNRSESVSWRIKQAYRDLVPHSIVIGEKELSAVGNKNLSSASKLENDPFPELDNLKDEMQGKPFIPRQWPMMVGDLV